MSASDISVFNLLILGQMSLSVYHEAIVIFQIQYLGVISIFSFYFVCHKFVLIISENKILKTAFRVNISQSHIMCLQQNVKIRNRRVQSQSAVQAQAIQATARA